MFFFDFFFDFFFLIFFDSSTRVVVWCRGREVVSIYAPWYGVLECTCVCVCVADVFFSLSFFQEGFSSMRGQQQQQQQEEEEEEEEEELLSTHTQRKKFSQSCCFCSCV